ncbi:MAG: hypothetical protein H7A49_10345 [Akkermansiaceae bacterium]|nr:hypothetical protein [Akkermansiaceae bacterium]MCP5544288.1 hypothetical protein [Akkermansiaceae bacterium]MCP5546988.1 hypothetical protein [Akkermansiaceae bacterium]
MKPFVNLLSAVLITAICPNSDAAVLAFWDFNNGFVEADASPQIVHGSVIGVANLYQQRADTDGNGKGGNAFADAANGINAVAGQSMAWDDIAKSGDNDAEFFLVFSTIGYKDIEISFDFQNNGTSPIESYDLKFSLNTLQDVTNPGDVSGTVKDFAGGVSTEITNNTAVSASTSFTRVAVNLSSQTAINDQGYVAIRFDDWQNGAANDDMRIDNVLITGNLVPEPSAAVLAGLGALALLRRRRVATSTGA